MEAEPRAMRGGPPAALRRVTYQCPVDGFIRFKHPNKPRFHQDILQMLVHARNAHITATGANDPARRDEGAQSPTIDPVYPSKIEYQFRDTVQPETGDFLLKRPLTFLPQDLPLQGNHSNIRPDLFCMA
jgi:hypothetical protein